MLWRQAYETRIERGVVFPSALEAPVVIGGFDLRSDAERQIWLRLIRADFSSEADFLEVVWRPHWTPEERETLELITSPSRIERTRLLEDPGRAWETLAAPDKPERAMVAILPAGLLMVGPPTEEAWSQFASTLTALGW